MTSTSFTIVRDVLYGFIGVASIPAAYFAGNRVSPFHAHNPDTINPYAIVLAAAGFSWAFLIPRHILCRVNRLPGFLAHLWVELALLWSTSVIYLVAAGYATYHLEGFHTCRTERCHRFVAMQALSWTAWTSTVILMGMLVYVAIAQRRKGAAGALMRPMPGKVVDEDAHEGDYGVPMATKGEGFAGREQV